jgi:hypothetical protein
MDAKCYANEKSPPFAPMQTLNGIAIDVINILSTANKEAKSIKELLFGVDEDNLPNAAEPCNLESHLYLIRAMAQDLETKISLIQGRV